MWVEPKRLGCAREKMSDVRSATPWGSRNNVSVGGPGRVAWLWVWEVRRVTAELLIRVPTESRSWRDTAIPSGVVMDMPHAPTPTCLNSGRSCSRGSVSMADSAASSCMGRTSVKQSLLLEVVCVECEYIPHTDTGPS